jgi:hypothetical protein
MAGAGAAAVERAHDLYRGGRHREALELYSAALAAARGTAQRIALHSNRAACYLKLHDFHKVRVPCSALASGFAFPSAEDCGRLLRFDFADCGVGGRPFGASKCQFGFKKQDRFLAVHA